MQSSPVLSIVGTIVTALLFFLTVMFFRKNKQVLIPSADAFEVRGQQVIHQVAETTQETTSFKHTEPMPNTLKYLNATSSILIKIGSLILHYFSSLTSR